VAKTTTTDKSLPQQVSELWDLIVGYAKQETVNPLKRLRRFVQYGMIGSVLLAVGFVLLSLALLRALQVETFPHWTGHWSWVPYAITLAGSALVASALAFMITVDRRRAARRHNGKGA
jgi:hypothetical protein